MTKDHRNFCMESEIGKRFGRLVVEEFAYRKNNTYWKCKCDCGKECFVCSPNLLGRFTISCGCRNEENKKALATHVRQRACGRNDAVSH